MVVPNSHEYCGSTVFRCGKKYGSLSIAPTYQFVTGRCLICDEKRSIIKVKKKKKKEAINGCQSLQGICNHDSRGLFLCFQGFCSNVLFKTLLAFCWHTKYSGVRSFPYAFSTNAILSPAVLCNTMSFQIQQQRRDLILNQIFCIFSQFSLAYVTELEA